MKKCRQNLEWRFTEEPTAELFPGLKPEERCEAAENYPQYFCIETRIYDELDLKRE